MNARIAIGTLCLSAALAAQAPQTVQDEFAVYELLSPESASFTTDYEVAVTTPGATTFVDRIGPGLQPVAAASDGVVDVMTGAPLEFRLEGNGLAIRLARPVPLDGGQARLRIVKTYKDPKSYYRQDGGVVFTRPLAMRRAAIVLPAGYRLTESTIPAQVLSEPDGRVRVSYMYQGPEQPSFTIKAAPGAPTADAAKPRALTNARSWEPPPAQGPTERARLSERAHQDRDIVYFLQQPETHAFTLYHDYTESREGVDKYLNVVRTGSVVSNPSGRSLDTGESLKWAVLSGAEMKAAGIDAGGETVAADQQVVVTRFAPVKKGQSIRLRLSETYTAPQSYRLDGDELTFERGLGRPRNSVVLPRGWYLVGLSIPAAVRQTPDGLTRVDFVNGRPDSIDVLIKAKKMR
jgi:hypothetical protein